MYRSKLIHQYILSAVQRQTAVAAYFLSSSYCCLPLHDMTAKQRQTAITAYFCGKQLLLLPLHAELCICSTALL